jgi:effector-binding domain-containing protein
MKLIKSILYSLLGILTIYLIANFFFDRKFEVETSVEIDSSPFIVYNQISDFSNWKNWDPWLTTDTTIETTLSPKPYEVGAFRQWKSENSGEGTIELTDNIFLKSLEYKITIKDNSPFHASFNILPIDSGVKVNWKNYGELPFLARIFGPVMTKMMKADHEKGLELLKNYCESIPSSSGEVSIKDWDSQNVISITKTCSTEGISSTLSESYNAIFVFLAQNGIMPTSSPFSQYIEFPNTAGGENKVIIKSGTFIEVPVSTNLPTNMEYTQKPASLSAQAIHKGDYRTIFKTHEKIRAFCEENGYNFKPQPYEIYLTDPQLTTNSSSWETLVLYELE